MTAARLALVALVAAGCGGGAPESGPVTVTGAVSYEDRAPNSAGRLDPVTPAPARFVALALIGGDGTTLGETMTADDGTFSIATTVELLYADGAQLHLTAATTAGADLDRPIEVVRSDGMVHGFGGPDFAADAPDLEVDLLVPEDSDEAGAFNIYDKLIDAVDGVRALGYAPAPLTAIWQRGSQDGTYYDGANTMHLLGGSDDDSYDDSVILHESGHWIEDTLGRSDSSGGGHDGSPTDPNLAWSEGFATYWGLQVLGAPLYVDTAQGGGWSWNADQSSTAFPGGALDADISEDTVAEILWDLGDDASDDAIDGSHDEVVRVQPEYLRTTGLRAVGEPGVDLVDFLDGFFVADGLSHCAGVRAIVTTGRAFPYDYAGPAGSCP